MDYKILQEQKDALKIDKDFIEIQKTIINYGEKIISKLDKIIKMLDNEQQKIKYDIKIEQQEEINLEKDSRTLMSSQIGQMIIPKGYKGN